MIFGSTPRKGRDNKFCTHNRVWVLITRNGQIDSVRVPPAVLHYTVLHSNES
jgi:hypothetical protein